jgi:hypothetical protein
MAQHFGGPGLLTLTLILTPQINKYTNYTTALTSEDICPGHSDTLMTGHSFGHLISNTFCPGHLDMLLWNHIKQLRPTRCWYVTGLETAT